MQWQGLVQCLQRFYWIFVICLKIVILLRVGEQKKTSRPWICSRYPFTTASWFIVKFYNLIQAICISALAIYVYTINLLLSAVLQKPQRERLKGRSAEFCLRSVAFVYRPVLFRQGSEVNNLWYDVQNLYPLQKKEKKIKKQRKGLGPDYRTSSGSKF